jgi:hypothetical protein
MDQKGGARLKLHADLGQQGATFEAFIGIEA